MTSSWHTGSLGAIGKGMNELDAMRYRRLSDFVGSEVIVKVKATDIYDDPYYCYLDDKEEMDAYLDAMGAHD